VKPYDNLLARLAEKRDALLCEAGGAR
jgi:hypothetical protein